MSVLTDTTTIPTIRAYPCKSYKESRHYQWKNHCDRCGHVDHNHPNRKSRNVNAPLLTYVGESEDGTRSARVYQWPNGKCEVVMLENHAHVDSFVEYSLGDAIMDVSDWNERVI